MKLGIMQPYFLPYIGYWQLMNYVDKYVIYDDVNYIKGGWIDRNRILVDGQVNYLNLPVIGKSAFKHINEIEVNTNKEFINKTIRKVEASYKKAKYYNDVMPLFLEIINYNEKNLALFIKHSFEVIAKYLDIQTEFIISSDIEKNNDLKGQDKVIEICKKLNATEYINAIGGQELYSKETFKENEIDLHFLKTNNIKYQQLSNNFESNLSILDVLMNCSKNECKEYLNSFELV